MDRFVTRTPKNGGGSAQKGEDSAEEKRRHPLRDIAAGTLDAIKHGSYLQHDLSAGVQACTQNTKYYAPHSLLSTWETAARPYTTHTTAVSLLEVSTLDGARFLASSHSPSLTAPPTKIGVLNFASAKNPGGGFINGAQAQEESIARSSTLYPSLMTPTAQQFYALHRRAPREGFYSHAMIYSPGVVLFRDDRGGWTDPLAVDVLTSPAVNAGVVRRYMREAGHTPDETEAAIAAAMRERIARVLFLFELQGVRDLVLGSFGTGVFRNDVETVAGIWGELLLTPGARFSGSFENAVFAVLGNATFEKFQEVFGRYGVS